MPTRLAHQRVSTLAQKNYYLRRAAEKMPPLIMFNTLKLLRIAALS